MKTLKRFKSYISFWGRIKFKLWWWFKATDIEKAEFDMIGYGCSIIKNGKRIDPKDFFSL